MNILKFASVLFDRISKFLLPGLALASLVMGIYYPRSGSSSVLAAPAATSRLLVPGDGIDQSALLTARRVAALAHGSEEQGRAAQAIQVADRAVDEAFAIALREAADTTPLKGEALATSLQISVLEKRVEEDKQHVVALNTARLMTASQNDVANLGERAQAQLEVDTDKLNELHRDLMLLGGDKQASIQRAFDEHDALQQQAVVYAAGKNDLESPQNLANLPGKVRAFFEMRAREKQLRQAGEEATTSAARMTHQKDATEARIQEQQQLAATYSSWAELTKAKRVAVQHGILLTLAMLVGIFIAVPFGVILIRRELAGGVEETRGRYPVVAELVVEALGLAMILIVIFGIPGRMPVTLG